MLKGSLLLDDRVAPRPTFVAAPNAMVSLVPLRPYASSLALVSGAFCWRSIALIFVFLLEQVVNRPR